MQPNRQWHEACTLLDFISFPFIPFTTPRVVHCPPCSHLTSFMVKYMTCLTCTLIFIPCLVWCCSLCASWTAAWTAANSMYIGIWMFCTTYCILQYIVTLQHCNRLQQKLQHGFAWNACIYSTLKYMYCIKILYHLSHHSKSIRLDGVPFPYAIVCWSYALQFKTEKLQTLAGSFRPLHVRKGLIYSHTYTCTVGWSCT